MKNLNYLNEYRKPHPIFKLMGDEFNGFFEIGDIRVIASNGNGWDHVSVSKSNKQLPRWGEMSKIKDLFFNDEETVVQFHPKKSEYIDNHPVLHLWKKQDYEYELPPSITIGIK